MGGKREGERGFSRRYTFRYTFTIFTCIFEKEREREECKERKRKEEDKNKLYEFNILCPTEKSMTAESAKSQLLLNGFFSQDDLNVTFMCDVCLLDHGDSRECLDNIHCGKCETYYDRCESHKDPIECPFCERKKEEEAKSQGGEE